MSVVVLAGLTAAQVEQEKFEGSGLQAHDSFGVAVALSGDWAVVGASDADDVATNSGAAYVFQHSSQGWIEWQRLKAGDPTTSAGFGFSVRIEGNRMAIGAPAALAQGNLNSGAIYVFELSGGSWSQTAKLAANDAAINFFLGYSIALSGNRIIGGAVGEWHAGINTGAAYIFELASGTWTQVAKVVANDGVSGDHFGWSVGLNGDVAVAGAVGAFNGSINYVGAAYVYERQGAQWVQTQKLTPPNPSRTQAFGMTSAVTVDGILVGAPNNHIGAPGGGAVFVFQHPNSTWDQVQVLTPRDIASADAFGSAISVSGTHAVIGDYSHDTPFGYGAIYVFEEAGSTWRQTGKCFAADMVYGDGMGDSCAIDGTTILAGNVFFDGACPGMLTCDSGAAYFFEIAPGVSQYGSCGGASPCSNSDGHGGCRNSTGYGAVLAACGTKSVAADDLSLEARWLPPGVNAIGFLGRARTSAFLGDGLRVVSPGLGSGLYRLPLASADASGVLHYGPGLVALSQGLPAGGHIQPGEQWNLQVWYRDVAGPCGSGTNTTNGLSLVFAP
ncbi:MAG: FG-GAP repeat protein [Planctomycetes bacterium]|nr:FG-GAP repeat protein [Planctomycetota bacterium]